MARTIVCDTTIRQGRLRKAESFLALAETGRELDIGDGKVSDAVVTSYIHAGIAAADVICCARLGKHANSGNHGDSVSLLRGVDTAAAKHLEFLLGIKSRSGYSHEPTGHSAAIRAQRAAENLVEEARRVHRASRS